MKERDRFSLPRGFRTWLPLVAFVALVAILTLYQVRVMHAAPLGSFLRELRTYSAEGYPPAPVGGVVTLARDELPRVWERFRQWMWIGLAGVLVTGGLGVVWYRNRRRQR